MSEEKKIESVPSVTPKKSGAGKGDKPRNISRKFWDNWDKIMGVKKSKYK